MDNLTPREINIKQQENKLIAEKIWTNLNLNDIDGEIWKAIPDFEGHYQVSNFGRIKSIGRWTNFNSGRGFRKEKILKQCLDTGQDYLRIRLGGYNKKTFRIHVLVARAFIPNPNNYLQINHKLGVKIDNRADQLEWVTRQMDVDHAWKMGLNNEQTVSKGEDHCCAKLTISQVLEIRKLYYVTPNKESNCKELAEKFNVSKAAIQGVVHRHNWKHI